jgi:hypothetical protein
MGLIAGALVGGAVIAAGGAVAAGAMQADATNRANASSAAATKKYMKLASAEAERGYGDMMAAIGKLGGSQSGLSNTYIDRTGKLVDQYGQQVKEALGNFPDYFTGWSGVVDKADQNVTDFETRSRNVIKESADQTYDYNLGRFDDFTNFATRLSEENQKIRLNLARAATPLFDETRSQMALNDLQLTQGIVPASVQAEIERAAAQRALGAGTGAGSQLKNNLSMRDLGLSSMAGIQQGQQNFQNRQLQDYNTLVAGTQVGVENVYNWMGLNTNKVIDVNNENSWKLFEAQKVPLDYKMVGLNTALDKRFDLATNQASFLHTTYSNVYGQESETARAMAAMEAAAAEARTNAKLGIAGQGLSNAYASANRSMASGLANAQLVSNASSQIGGSLMGFGMAGMTGGGSGGFSSYGQMTQHTAPGTTGSYVQGSGWVPRATAA